MKMKAILKLNLILIASILFLSCEGNFISSELENSKLETDISNKPSVNKSKLQVKAKEALDFCKRKGYNSNFCFLIDMSLHSGVNRFFIWNFLEAKIEDSLLVAHGTGNYPWNNDFTKENPSFSNKDGSHCTSLGKYKIGIRGYSDWGIHVKYLMHGLEESNSNALARQVVFHSWERVSDTEVYPDGTPEGWGCPAISNAKMLLIDKKLKASKSPVLMWIYN
jgi:hypothetical protein